MMKKARNDERMITNDVWSLVHSFLLRVNFTFKPHHKIIHFQCQCQPWLLILIEKLSQQLMSQDKSLSSCFCFLISGVIGIGAPVELSETTGALHAFNIPLVAVGHKYHGKKYDNILSTSPDVQGQAKVQFYSWTQCKI